MCLCCASFYSARAAALDCAPAVLDYCRCHPADCFSCAQGSCWARSAPAGRWCWTGWRPLLTWRRPPCSLFWRRSPAWARGTARPPCSWGSRQAPSAPTRSRSPTSARWRPLLPLACACHALWRVPLCACASQSPFSAKHRSVHGRCSAAEAEADFGEIHAGNKGSAAVHPLITETETVARCRGTAPKAAPGQRHLLQCRS